MSGSGSAISRTNLYERLAEAVREVDAPRALGRVAAARGDEVEVEGLALPVGGAAFVRRADGSVVEGEVMGVSAEGARLRLVESGEGVVVGARVEFGGRSPVVRLSRALLGRAIDALARPADGRGALPGTVPVALARSSARTRRAARKLVWGATSEDRASFLARVAAEHDGPVVALLVGGTAASDLRFVETLGPAAARTASVVEPGWVSRARAWRAARVAGTLAGFLAEAEGRPALVVADWRVRVTTPAGLALHGASVSIWSFGAGARARDGDFDSVTDVSAEREVA
ncbi:MAG: hypothetical protein ACYTKD_21830 [Planctomycetota bacterium]|jgi:hypothetical protein